MSRFPDDPELELDQNDNSDDEYCDDDEEFWDDEDDSDHIAFAQPSSALRAASPTNPRNCPCRNCERPNRLTPDDVNLGYQCDECADRAERGLD